MVQSGMLSLPRLNNPKNTLMNLRELENEQDQQGQSRSNEKKMDKNEALTQNEWELKGFSLLEFIPLSKSNQVGALRRQA